MAPRGGRGAERWRVWDHSECSFFFFFFPLPHPRPPLFLPPIYKPSHQFPCLPDNWWVPVCETEFANAPRKTSVSDDPMFLSELSTMFAGLHDVLDSGTFVRAWIWLLLSFVVLSRSVAKRLLLSFVDLCSNDIWLKKSVMSGKSKYRT